MNPSSTRARWSPPFASTVDNLLMFLIKREDPSYRDSYRAPDDDGPRCPFVDVPLAIRQAALASQVDRSTVYETMRQRARPAAVELS